MANLHITFLLLLAAAVTDASRHHWTAYNSETQHALRHHRGKCTTIYFFLFLSSAKASSRVPRHLVWGQTVRIHQFQFMPLHPVVVWLLGGRLLLFGRLSYPSGPARTDPLVNRVLEGLCSNSGPCSLTLPFVLGPASPLPLLTLKWLFHFGNPGVPGSAYVKFA